MIAAGLGITIFVLLLITLLFSGLLSHPDNTDRRYVITQIFDFVFFSVTIATGLLVTMMDVRGGLSIDLSWLFGRSIQVHGDQAGIAIIAFGVVGWFISRLARWFR